MYSTQVYIYQQIARVLMMDSGAGETFIYRYDPVYAKKLTINKGVDNVILFEFVNQEEKPVNITGSSFIFRAINTESSELLLQKELQILNAATGRAKVQFSGSELLEITAQPASYSIQRTQPSGGYSDAVFVNAQAGARAPIDIVDSILPQFVPSSELTIPTTKLSNQITYDGSNMDTYPGGAWYWNGNPNGASYYTTWLNTVFYSSFIEPRGPVTTIQMDLIGYTGTIKIQGAENYQSLWYNVTESETYYNETRTIHRTVVGWHPILRVAFNDAIFATPKQPGVPAQAYVVCGDGQVQGIYLTENGSGYLAPPKISIVGNGAGATAEATINEAGSVTSITVTNPGSGYWPVPNMPNPGAQPSPLTPNQTGAIVNITTGFITNLLYR